MDGHENAHRFFAKRKEETLRTFVYRSKRTKNETLLISCGWRQRQRVEKKKPKMLTAIRERLLIFFVVRAYSPRRGSVVVVNVIWVLRARQSHSKTVYAKYVVQAFVNKRTLQRRPSKVMAVPSERRGRRNTANIRWNHEWDCSRLITNYLTTERWRKNDWTEANLRSMLGNNNQSDCNSNISSQRGKKKMKSSLLSVGFNWNEMSLRTVNTPDMRSFVVVVAFLNKPLAHSLSGKREFFPRIASHHFFFAPCWLNAKTRFSYKRPERHKTG